jgi:DNA-binding PadR family transcriptional regulator
MKTLEIPVVESWEGRYSTVKEFQEKTKDINLRDGQSIWVISNGTMYRILKKAEK